uniref:hypothetical protein n=1 Tax=Flavobacterium sp. TaxID=239 RepID=UPI00404924DD
MKKIIYLVIILISFGCKPIAAKLILGVDTTPEWKTQNEILSDFEKHQIPTINRFILDTAIYSKTVEKQVYKNVEMMKANGIAIDSIIENKIQKSFNDNLQPVQVRYFNSDGSPIFKLVNCYLENVFKMDWNFDKSFDVYPPSTNDEILNFGNENLAFFIPMFRNLDGSVLNFNDLPKSKYYVIVFWNSFFNKPSRKLINQIQKIEKDKEHTFVLYVNNHNAELYDLIPDEQKQDYINSLHH